MEKNEKLDNLRHSAAHLLAQAVIELYPGTKLTIGPTTPLVQQRFRWQPAPSPSLRRGSGFCLYWLKLSRLLNFAIPT